MAESLGLKLLAPRKKITIMLIGNSSLSFMSKWECRGGGGGGGVVLKGDDKFLFFFAITQRGIYLNILSCQYFVKVGRGRGTGFKV